MEKERRDLKINGSMTWPGGVFKNITINGEGNIDGDLDCLEFKANGACSINGDGIIVDTGRIRGKGVISGNLKAGEFRASGAAVIKGNVNVKSFRAEGEAKIEQGLTAEVIEARGDLRVQGDCQAEEFHLKGAFTIGGLLNAGVVEASLYGDCRAKEIGGESITIRRGKGLSLFGLVDLIHNIFDWTEGLSVDIVEGDEIYLEYTKAKVVRGNNVVIGPGCEIDLVEYKNSFEARKDALVKGNKQI